MQYIENQTEEMCQIAINASGLNLEYVKDQDPEICLAAVKQDGLALRYVENRTPELCLEAAKNKQKCDYVYKRQRTAVLTG